MKIAPDDLRVDVFSAARHVPVSVRVIHLPTGQSASRTGFGRTKLRDECVQELEERLCAAVKA
jgi:protein subunit release factor A